ncbi:MAG: bifunctional precorrin-2 dehydrogenase/sirohydrochlorin ferrochelatase [Anaerolineae bacterium]|nr:MAG: bifunctional precorrin-2 dehydrogenase/sirohydrochlorin ferrochelatase [Anaerolineae bacterium]
MSVYPICLINLQSKKCLVIGGGMAAERKVATLLASEAQVVVISSTLTPTLRRWAKAGSIAHAGRDYQPGDLEGAFLCFAATSDGAVNEQICRDGDALGVLVNAVDAAAPSHFMMPAILRRGDLMIAISTGGHSPALAVAIKERLTALFGPEYGGLVHILGALRPRLKAELDREGRLTFTRAVLGSGILSLLKENDRPGALAGAEEILADAKTEN